MPDHMIRDLIVPNGPLEPVQNAVGPNATTFAVDRTTVVRQANPGGSLGDAMLLRSLKAKFLLFAVILILTFIVETMIGWSVTDRGKAISAGSAATIGTVMADIDLLQDIKNMQICTLLMQNEFSSLASADPDDVANDVRQAKRKFAAALKDIIQIIRAHHIDALGPVRDVAERIGQAQPAFNAILVTLRDAQAAVSATGKAPSQALIDKAGAQVDGLYEELDPMAEGVGLIVADGNAQIRARNRADGAALDLFEKGVLGISAIGLIICGFVVVLLLRGVLAPLLSLAATTRRIAEGDLSMKVPHFRATELNGMAEELEVFRGNLLETERLKSEQTVREAAAREDKRQAMEALADGFESQIMGVVRQLGGAVDQLRENAQGLTATAQGTLRQSAEVARASTQASESTQTAASAAEQLARSIAEISSQMQNATTVVYQALDGAKATDETVTRLNDAARKIGKVVQSIQAVARQTNLLALNATIEAARAGDAGDAGRGFAVVAGEVKNLAAQTAEATADIQTQVGAIQHETELAVAAIRGILTTMEGISQITIAVASAVEEQDAATREIARSVQQAAEGTTGVSENIIGVTDAAGETGDAANSVMDAATALAKQSALLRAEVTTFTRVVRTG